MSGRGGAAAAAINNTNNNGKGDSGISGIPSGSRKMVQSLKEIVNCPEPEIYAMLKECNMDPNEAVNRLLSQDPFHEVKSKREKKKENKETTDPRARGANNTTHRGGRGGADRYGRGNSAQFSSSETGVSHAKPAPKKENGTHAYTGSQSSGFSIAGNNTSWGPQAFLSDSVATENKMSTVGVDDGVSLPLQPPGFQSPWLGVPGQVSMADIVKMGRPHNRASAMPPHHCVNHHHASAPPLAASNNDFPENHAANMSEINSEPELSASQHVHPDDEWPSIQEPSASTMPSILEAPEDSEVYADQSNFPLDRVNQHMKSELDDVQPAEDGHVETLNGDHVGPASVSSRNIQEDGSVGSSIFDNNLYGNVSSYQPPRHAFEHEAEDGASSVAANLHQLSLQSDQGLPPEEDNPSVIIPNHLQVHAQNCSHLSFGSFRSGISSAFSGPFASGPLKNNPEETSEVVDASSAVHPDTRNSEYYGDEHLRNTADENLMHRAGVNAGNYDSASVPQAEVLKEEPPEAAQVNQYTFPSSATGYNYEDSQQSNAVFSNPQTSSQMQNFAPFSSVMQAYTNSLPSTLLASTVQPGREPDLPYSPFPVTQSMPTKYSNTASSISGPSISVSEALRAGSISTTQPTPQTLPGASVATGPTLPQHLAVHPYSQPTLPLGPFTNMIGYPFLPQSYTYMPSAFQQTFAGNSTYHQSLAAVLPQYKNSVSVSSLPQSAAVASAYGFGSSTSLPAGNFPLNAPTAPGGTTIGYDDVLSSQYKDGSHLISLQQQNENSAMWVHGPGSRTMSAVPASTYYSFQGQNQQPGGFRQGQQLSQHFGAHGYPNYYHSQTGISLEQQQQQQNSRDGSLGGSQGQSLKQAQQLWQNSY
ncbi:uncharacterized protein LOC110601137 isoform X2 [Manihot esculenta]|uniref:GBF-interacting protein 1 N-terminal domain-containing protein n=1 Tax=Manihot esculenta TaxID=3983 RepID=A0A2C9UEY7_MANES|nr:uncharacterized protein LOC110601137 isoform X2 [Manihot esculenta]OAY29101.1 hypothetical protein MANES_15G117700v8 [Manihot esculenta]